MSHTEIVRALELIQAGGFRPGTEWEEAHRICQTYEGERDFDWIHAILHRIEGDDANAGYWYSRAGKSRNPGSVEEEWREMMGSVTSNGE